MRSEANASKVRAVLEAIGRQSSGPGAVFVTGGGSAVLVGWRDATIDVDLKLDPEPAGVFAALARIKDELDVNIELASPDMFLPPVPGWRERSMLIREVGEVAFFHYDFASQALAKVERGHQRDLLDVHAMLKERLIRPKDIETAHGAIADELPRYPSVDPEALRKKVEAFLKGLP